MVRLTKTFTWKFLKELPILKRLRTQKFVTLNERNMDLKISPKRFNPLTGIVSQNLFE